MDVWNVWDRKSRFDPRMWLLVTRFVACYSLSTGALCSTSIATSPSRHTRARPSPTKSHHARSSRPTPQFLLSHRCHPLLGGHVVARAGYHVIRMRKTSGRAFMCKRWMRHADIRVISSTPRGTPFVLVCALHFIDSTLCTVKYYSPRPGKQRL